MHQLVHSDAKPFACEIFPKAYKSRRMLRHHYSRHHQVERELNPEGLQLGFSHPLPAGKKSPSPQKSPSPE